MISQPTFSIEATPAGRGFAHGDLVRSCADWQDALDGAAYCADHSDHPTIFWAVERETAETGTQTLAAPVIRKASFGALSPFASGSRYAPQGITQGFTLLFDNGGGITLITPHYCSHSDDAQSMASNVATLLDGGSTAD